MNHVNFEKWVQYVRGEIDDHTREQLDAHLYSCDQCLSIYLEVVEAQEQSLPMMANEDGFTNSIMKQIESQKLPEKIVSVKKTSFYQKAAFHYIVAAAMTLILMSSGVFSQLMNYVSDFESANKHEPSAIEGLMNNTVSFIDKVQKESEGESKK